MDVLRERRIIHTSRVINLNLRMDYMTMAQKGIAKDQLEWMIAYAVLIAKPIDPNTTRGRII